MSLPDLRRVVSAPYSRRRLSLAIRVLRLTMQLIRLAALRT
jgi:hypothetical protein